MDQEAPRQLANPPIVEAVVDVLCDLPPNVSLEMLEGPAKEAFQGRYPVFEIEQFFEQTMEIQGGAPKHSSRQGLRGFRFWTTDRKQLVQVRREGLSFNRLAPYTTMDDYLPEIEKCWLQYKGFANPISVRAINIRQINKLLLPMEGGKADLDAFLNVGPRSPDPDGLLFAGFVHQHMLVEAATNCQASVILASQPPEGANLPVILDITATAPNLAGMQQDWASILTTIQQLRKMKNNIFFRTVKRECLIAYQ